MGQFTLKGCKTRAPCTKACLQTDILPLKSRKFCNCMQHFELELLFRTQYHFSFIMEW